VVTFHNGPQNLDPSKHVSSMKVLICNFESLQTPSGVASFAIKLLRHLPCLEALTTRNLFRTPLEVGETSLEAKTRFNEILWIAPAKLRLLYRKVGESDLIHLNPFNFSELVLFLFAKIHRKKCIATMHSNINFHFPSLVVVLEICRLIIVFHIILLLTDHIVFLTGAHYENYRKYSIWKNLLRNKSSIIPNAIESRRILGHKQQNQGPLSCIFVGRFEKRKGIYDLLTVAEQLREESIDFLLVGYGAIQRQEKIIKNVRMIGRVPNEELFSHYDRCKVLFFPSYTEAFGITLLEAMARGLVLLISDIPGIREFVQEGRNGYLFPPGDIEQMKERLLYLKHHPEEIERISRNNLSDVHRFTVERQAEKYLDIYRNVLNYDQGHF
jgi:glycosyltransferase involved in cell wall biosynthesis